MSDAPSPIETDATAFKARWPFLSPDITDAPQGFVVRHTFGPVSIEFTQPSAVLAGIQLQDWAMQRASDSSAKTYEARKALKEWADTDEKKAWLAGK
jgi:hypothetical protein